MEENPLVHPCIIRMIESGGSTMADYVRATARCRMYRTRSDLGDPSTRMLAMPKLPPHTGGYTHRDEIMVSVWLSERVRFLSAVPGDGASILMDQEMLPETMLSAVEGRRIDEILDHPMLRVDGMTVTKVERMGAPYAGKVRLRMADVPWRRMRDPVEIEI